MIQIPYYFDSNHNITAINRAMNQNTTKTSIFSNNLLYQANSDSLIGSQNTHNNMQNNVDDTIDRATHDVSSNIQPHNQDYTTYHRQLDEYHSMALAQLGSKESVQVAPPYDDLTNTQINIDYPMEINNFVSTNLHQHHQQQHQNISPTSTQTQSAVTSLVNQKPPVYTKWTEQEDELLRAAVRMYGPHKWSLIATHVPNRTPMQCSARWVGALNPSILKGRWTSQEDNALKEAVGHYINSFDSQGNPQPIPWNKVSKRIPQRTGAQCQARWTEALDPRIRKGKWSPSEDEILKEGVRMFGRCWIRIAEMIDGRTQRQCRTRWLQIKNKQSRVKNEDINANGDNDNNGTMLILTPPNTTPSTPAQRIKNVSSPDIIKGVILRSSPQIPQMITTVNNPACGTLTSPISNSGQSPIISDSETPISSPEFANTNYIPMVDTNSLNNCNLYYNNGTPFSGVPYVDFNNNVTYIF